MKMVIATLSFVAGSETLSYDMEMPCQVETKSLITHICQTIQQYTEGRISLDPNTLQLSCRRLNRTLHSQETFDDAGIWNGDHLELVHKN